MIRGLVGDDFPVIRFAVREALKKLQGTVVAEAGSGAEILQLLTKLKVEIVIFDAWLGGRCCVEMIREVKRKHPGVKVLVFSSRPAQELALRVIRAGADGFLSKTVTIAELQQAIRSILSGFPYVDRHFMPMVLAELRGGVTHSQCNQLSDREYEVASSLLNGESYKEIAGKLGISVKTISNYRRRGLDKLNETTAAQFRKDYAGGLSRSQV